MIHVFKLFRRLPIGQTRAIGASVILGTTELYLQGGRIINSKTNKPEYLIIASYCDRSESISRYGERWYIENIFKDMKSNGFQLECTHVTKIERLNTLMGILAIAYVWMIKIGIWIKKMKPERFVKKKHGRPAKSIFRGGLDEFINALFTMDPIRVRRYVKFLSCT
ncbi:MAG: transposase [Saprospiraceae bacterium]|nr:transposase [Saprospiraceae bacterium]